MIATLENLAKRCHGDDRPDCPIIEGLAEIVTGGGGGWGAPACLASVSNCR